MGLRIFEYRSKKLVDIGYKKLRKENNLEYLINLSNSLAKIPTSSRHNIFKQEMKLIDKCTLQFLIQRRLYLVFNKNILAALGRESKELKLGLPKKWLLYLEQSRGFKADTKLNYLRWIIFILFWYCYGILKIFSFFFHGIFKKEKINSKNYVYFDNLSKKSIPNKSNLPSETIIDWYIKYTKEKNIGIYHGYIKSKAFKLKDKLISPSYFPFKVELSYIEWIQYLIRCFFVAIYSFYAFLRGDFSHALLLKEYPLLYLSKKSNFGKKYFFHNSTHIFRPLWTYEAENKGAEIILYFYSTNNEFLKFEKGRIKNFDFPQFMSWNHFFVWNSFQANYVKDYLPEVKVSVVGSIWFESSGKIFPKLDSSKKIISIFDFQPFTEERYQLLGFPDRYMTSEVSKKFQNDIYEVFKKKDVLVVLKRKREALSYNDQSYIDFVNDLYSSKRFIQIDPGFSATKLIEKSFLTINFPMTSTANISRERNINTIYYDPISKVDKRDPSLSGIKLINGIDELNKYVENNLSIKNE